MTACSVVAPEPEPWVPYESRCIGLLCGNSGETLHYLIHEAHLGGQPNQRDIALRTNANGRAEIFDKFDEPYELHVEGGRIFGVHEDGSVMESDQLEGATLWLLQAGTPIGSIQIARTRMIEAPLGKQDPIEVYTLLWAHPDSTAYQENACISNPGLSDGDLYGMDPEETLVFEGTRIQTETITVDPDWQPEWFSFGCAGHTLAKLRLTGHTELSENYAWKESQAMLKMYAADYCGDGFSFTVGGTPLVWMGGLAEDYYSTPNQIEARWTEAGASCLMVPRLAFHPHPEFPNVSQMVNDACSIPSCSSNPETSDLDGALRISGNLW